MQNLLNDLKDLLKKDERFVSDRELLKNKIVEVALKDDDKLLELILSNKRLKEHFFTEVKGKLIFKKDVFLRFVNNKDFLPDSYTSFKNKVGLTYDDEYFSEKKEVVLSFPYKDCVLEGGQTKEEVEGNRPEIFWNVTLAPDEVDRLLEPKVLTNFKKIDEKGAHKITEIKSTDNLVVKGNNLLALQSLKKKFAERIKLIYIDPPYNTGGDSFNYNDRFNHSSWLTFMKNRLEVAKELLDEDGTIFIQIDDKEYAYLKVLCDEIFDRENFLNSIVVKTSDPSGHKVVNPSPYSQTEYLLLYAKNRNKYKYETQYVASEYDSGYSKYIPNIADQHRKWKITSLEDTVAKKHGHDSVKAAKKALGNIVFQEFVAEFALENAKQVFQATAISDDAGKEIFEAREKSKKQPGEIIKVERKNYEDVYVLDGRQIYFYSNKVKEIDGELTPSKPLTNLWTDIPWNGIANEGGVSLKNGKKPEKLLRRIIELSTKPGDVVLDFFLGSGTTAAVAHKMGRQYVGIEQIDYDKNDAIIRLKNVIKGDSTGISKFVSWKGGGSFVYCELMEWNQKFVSQIQNSKTKDSIKKIWDQMKEKSFLSYKLNLKEFDKNISDLSLDDQKKFLFEVLDKNQLYVNFSEIEDADFAVSKEDKDLNKKFYGEATL